VQEVSTLGPEVEQALRRALCVGEGLDAAACPEDRRGTELKISPGGEKVMVRYRSAPDLAWVRARAETLNAVALRDSASNPMLQNARDHKVEIQLKSKGDQLLSGMREELGADTVPKEALRVEWIGPKAGAQLRNSAVKSIAFTLVFIMLYVAFRFDLRFSPGAVLALAHDVLATVGVLVLLGREINLATVAALLTVLGYSVNDTVVVYDRVRENFGILRGATFESIINISTSEMLGRTVLAAATTIFSLLAFFVWGTGPLGTTTSDRPDWLPAASFGVE
jgi:preprotein translocase subunit SecF